MTPPAVHPRTSPEIYYPETDGAPIAENTRQFEWIVTLKTGLDGIFIGRPDVFVAADLFWYPVEGDPSTVIAPDAMVAIGRPKGHRLSYKQWEEAGIAPQVVFEVLSPSNRGPELARKLRFYDRFGVEEYYLYDPEPGKFQLAGYLRQGTQLRPIPQIVGHTSPRLGIRFELEGETLIIIGPDSQRFLTSDELRERERAASEENARLRALLREKGIEPPSH